MMNDEKKNVFVTSDEKMKEGKVHDKDEQVMEAASSGEGVIEIESASELMEIARMARATHEYFLEEIRKNMTREQAEFVRKLRCEDDYSWRMIAAVCFDEKWDMEPWEPPSNQLAGMALCEVAAEFFGEHYREGPWNE